MFFVIMMFLLLSGPFIHGLYIMSVLNTSFQVRCEYTMANFSTGDRVRKSKGDRLFSVVCHFTFLPLVFDIFIMVKILIGFQHECICCMNKLLKHIIHLYIGGDFF